MSISLLRVRSVRIGMVANSYPSSPQVVPQEFLINNAPEVVERNSLKKYNKPGNKTIRTNT